MPEPILMTIAGALASKAANSLYDLVKEKFRAHRGPAAALEAASGKDAESPEVHALATALAQAEQDDPQFGIWLRAQWARDVDQRAEARGATNIISGQVTGKVVQVTGDIQGNINL